MKFLADKAIPHVEEAFSTIGEIQLLPPGKITPDTLKGVDGLLVRTTTGIKPSLLKGSRVTFVGTATIGTDHIDLPYLAEKGIHLSSAPGCNATAVGEYVLTALLTLEANTGISLQGRTLGIIGAGNTGNAVKRKAEAIGIRCLLNDPPLAERSPNNELIDIVELVQESDIISLHIPLTCSGKYPTTHLLNEALFSQLKPGTIIINTSRGEALDGNALKANRSRLGGVILDVWENEPQIDPELIPFIDIASPHIAGYSIEGKIRATEMIYRDACTFFEVPPVWDCEKALASYGVPQLTISDRDQIPVDVIIQGYDIFKDDSRLRLFTQQDNPGEYFANLRNQYRFRREFSSFQVNVEQSLSSEDRRHLSRLGFHISDGQALRISRAALNVSK